MFLNRNFGQSFSVVYHGYVDTATVAPRDIVVNPSYVRCYDVSFLAVARPARRLGFILAAPIEDLDSDAATKELAEVIKGDATMQGFTLATAAEMTDVVSRLEHYVLDKIIRSVVALGDGLSVSDQPAHQRGPSWNYDLDAAWNPVRAVLSHLCPIGELGIFVRSVYPMQLFGSNRDAVLLVRDAA